MNRGMKGAGLLVCVFALLSAAPVQAFPERTVTMVVPYPPGGGTDVVARTLAHALSARWGKPVVVENHSGADGLIGTRRALAAPADGHTILIQVNPMLMWPVTMPASDVDIRRDIRLITKIQHSPLTVSTTARFPGTTLADFFAWCKASSEPCSVGAATSYGHLMARHLTDIAGIGSTDVVRYRGTAPMLNDVLGRHLTLGMITVTSALAHAGKGDFKVLAVGSRTRFAAMPDVPTLTEQGYDITADVWYGMMVAKATPQAIVDAIGEAVRAASSDPAVARSILASGGQPVFNTPREFEVELDEELRVLTPILQKYPVNQ